MHKRNIYPVLGMLMMLLVSVPLFCFAEQSNPVKDKDMEFIKETDNLVKAMNENITLKSEQVKKMWDAGNLQEGYRIEGEIKGIIADYKKQVGSLPASAECGEFKTLIVRLLDLMENMHAALSEGNTERYKSLLPQVKERSNEMQQELQRLLKYYKG